MLDKYLETVCSRSKTAAIQAHNADLLGQLPDEVLYKLSCGFGDERGTTWLEQFKGTPLIQQAIAIEKEDLALQMERSDRRRQEDALRAQFSSFEEENAKRDQLSIKRKLLELELAGGGTGEVEGAAAPLEEHVEPEAVVEEPPVEEAALALPTKPKTEKVTKTTTEKPMGDKESIDVKAAAARLRSILKTASVMQASGLRRGVQLLTGSRARALEGQAARHVGEVATARTGANEAMRNAVFGAKGGVESERAAGYASRGLQDAIARSSMSGDLAARERAAVGQARTLGQRAALAGGGGLAAGVAGHRALDGKTASTIPTISAHTINDTVHAGAQTLGRIARNSAPVAAAAPAARAGLTSAQKIVAGTGAAGLGIGALAGGHHPQKTAMLLEDPRIKEAFLGALGAGLKGMGQFAQTAGKGILAAGKAGGMGAAGQAAANAGRAGVMRAGEFIAKNPMAGAAMVAAPAAAVGYAAGRQ
jgi:hypothetical protein